MKRILLVGLLAVFAAQGAAARTTALEPQPPRTLATVPGFVEGFAQDGDHIVWAETGRCGKEVVLRTLSSGHSQYLDGAKGPMCRATEVAGEIQPWMALAGTRALWAYMNASLSHYNFELFTAAAGEGVEREISEMSIEGGLSDEGGDLRTVPMAGHGSTLVYADINTDEGAPPGVYRVSGKSVEHVDGTELAFAVAVSGSRFALARNVPGGCACTYQPEWSPDGRQIAFLSGAGGAGSQLMVMNSDGTNVRRLLEDVGTFAWAPSGDTLAALQQKNDTVDLVVVKADGGAIQTLASKVGTESEDSFAWAPNGSRLAYVSASQSGEGRLFVISKEGGAPVDLGDATANYSLEWSPNSERIAYMRFSGDQGHVYVATVASRNANDIGVGASPTWAPDGSALAFERPDDGIYLAAPDGSGTRLLASASSALPYWSPDGRWIAFETNEGLWLVSPEGGPARKLVGDACCMEWSPHSDAIAYLADVGARQSVAVVRVPAGVIGFSTAGFSGPLDWSADGTRIAATAATADGGNGEVAVLDAQGGSAVIVTHTVPTPSKTVVEMRTSDGKLQSTFDASKALRGLAWGGSKFVLEIGTSKTRSTIEIRSASGKPLRRVSVPRPRFDELSMSGRWVVFQSGKSVRLLDADTGKTRVLAEVKAAWIVGLSIDGRRVAWAESTSKRSRIRAVFLPSS